MSSKIFKCFSCQEDVPYEAIFGVSKNDECRKCGSDLRVCFNCEFYDRSRQYECRESISENVRQKDKRNSCEFFKPQFGNLSGATNSASSLKDAAEALFKKKSS